MGLRTAIAGTLRSPMHTISKKLAKREKRARFPHKRARKIFWSPFGVYTRWCHFWRKTRFLQIWAPLYKKLVPDTHTQ